MELVHGLKNWNKFSRVGYFNTIQISCSFHIPGRTEPLRPFGYILRPSRKAILAIYYKDVCSYTIGGLKIVRKENDIFKCGIGDLEFLTPLGKHNEIIVDSRFIEIVGYYGNHKKFNLACKNYLGGK